LAGSILTLRLLYPAFTSAEEQTNKAKRLEISRTAQGVAFERKRDRVSRTRFKMELLAH